MTVVSAASKTSALYLATASGHEAVARRLVLFGADVHFRDPEENLDVLAKASEDGLGHLVNDLLTAGASPNTRDGHGRTPLHAAAMKGKDRVVDALAAKGADKDALDAEYCSPLVLAAERGYLSAVDVLLAAGAVTTAGADRVLASRRWLVPPGGDI